MPEQVTKHTKGPWVAVRDFTCDGDMDVEVFRVRANGREIAYTTQSGTSVGSEENKANSHLMAAAPALLQACESIRNDLQDRLLDCTSPGTRGTLKSQIEYLSSAIAQAKGKSNA